MSEAALGLCDSFAQECIQTASQAEVSSLLPQKPFDLRTLDGHLHFLALRVFCGVRHDEPALDKSLPLCALLSNIITFIIHRLLLSV